MKHAPVSNHILFLRHPKQQGRESEALLTVKGLEDARRTGIALRSQPGRVRIYTSPTPRAIQAAGIVASELALPSVTLDPLLNERTNKPKGDFDELEHKREWDISFRERDFVPRDGITVNQSAEHHYRALHEIRQSTDAETVLVIGHAGGLTALLSDARYVENVPEEILSLRERGVEGLADVIPPASITEVVLEAGKIYVVGKVGDTEHLEEKPELWRPPGMRR